MTVPDEEYEATEADFTMAIEGCGAKGIFNVEVPVTGGPLGGVPVAVPVLDIEPAFTSACVVV